MRLPPALGPGARVALVAPAGPLRNPAELDASVAQAEALGWEPVPGLNVLRRNGYLAGTDAERLVDLNAALQDDRIDGVWCARGGYGAMRILDGVDYDAMRRRPKMLVGYSDITALHTAFGRLCDVTSYHGPTARHKLTEFTRASLLRAVTERADSCGAATGARTLRGGRAAGRLVGGNLSLLAAVAGTRYAPDYSGAILVLEDVGELTYRIDRMLRQLALTGAFDSLAGIAFGHFTEGSDPKRTGPGSLDAILRETAEAVGVPTVSGIPLGHVDDQWTVPLGAHAELDADQCALHVRIE